MNRETFKRSFSKLYNNQVGRHLNHGVDYQEAQDIAQETMFRLLTVKEVRGDITHLVTRIGTTVKIHFWRLAHFQKRYADIINFDVSELEKVIGSGSVSEPTYGQRPAESQVEEKLQRDAVIGAMSLLTDKQQQVIGYVLRGLETEDISKETGIPEDAIRKLRRRATKTLQEALKEEAI